MKKICQFIRKFYWIIYLVLGLPILVSLIWLVGGRFTAMPYHISDSRLHLILYPLLELMLVFGLLHFACGNKTLSRSRKYWLLAFIFSLVNLILMVLLRNYYYDEAFAGYPTVQTTLLATLIAIYLFASAVLISFYKAFSCQIKNLPHLLPAIIRFFRKIFSKIKSFLFEFSFEEAPGSRRFTVIFLAVSFGIGLGLRLIKLDGFPPHVDEYIHTHIVKSMVDGAPLIRSRAFLTVNVPVYLSYVLFGVSLWTSRFPMVVLNMLGIFPLYALTKKINKTVGFLSVFLFITSPLILSASRMVREYAVAPLLFYTAAALLMDLLDWDGLTIWQFVRKHWLRILISLLILVYVLADNLSVLKITIAVYGLFGMVALLKLFKQKPKRWVKITVIVAGLMLFGLLIERSRIIARYFTMGSFVHRWTLMYWNTLFSRVSKWYAWKVMGVFVLFNGVVLSIIAVIKKYKKTRAVILFIFLNFLAILVYFTFFISTPRVPVRMRYSMLMEYWYLPIVALFLYFIFRIIKEIFSKHWISLILFTVILFSLFVNYSSIIYVINYSGSGIHRVTGNPHYIAEPAYVTLKSSLTEDDVLLADFIHRYDEITDRAFPDIEVISYYNYVFTQKNDPLNVVHDNSQGWFALSENTRFENYGILADDFVHDGKLVEYLGLFGNIHLWQW